jgi:hypothetical protein
MWRGYGGNGSGVAVVVDTAKLNINRNSPLKIARVQYHSRDERRAMIKAKIDQFVLLVKDVDPEESQFRVAADVLLERIQFLALTTKHHGFREEKEWRIVYAKKQDLTHSLEPMFGYAIGPRGIELKLKFQVAHFEEVTARDLSLAKIVERIIRGPTISSSMALSSVRRMFELTRRSALVECRFASEIPFRTA